MSEDPRSRYIYNPRRRSMLLVNYKCGFTSVTSALESSPEWKMDIKNPIPARKAYESGRFDGYDFHVVTRDPGSRVISYYWNWLVEKDETFVGPYAGKNRHFAMLERVATTDDYRSFVELGAEGRATPAGFALWLRWLPTLWPLDAHLWPQHLIFHEMGLAADQVNQWPTSQLGELFKNLGLPAAKRMNTTTIDNKAQLQTTAFREIIDQVYRRDFDELEFQRHKPAMATRTATAAAPPDPALVQRLVTKARADFSLPEQLIEGVYTQMLSPHDVAIDGGAHIGRHTRPLAQICTAGRVIAYEALPHLASKLAESLAGEQNVTVRAMALQHNPETTETTFQFVPDEPARSGITSSSINIAEHLAFDHETLTVPATTIDRDLQVLGIEPTQVAFVKLDLEGGEFDALRGAASLLQVAKPVVAFENNYFSGDVIGYSNDDMSEYFKSVGYTRVSVFGQILEHADFAFWYMFAAPHEKAEELAAMLAALSAELAGQNDD